MSFGNTLTCILKVHLTQNIYVFLHESEMKSALHVYVQETNKVEGSFVVAMRRCTLGYFKRCSKHMHYSKKIDSTSKLDIV